MFVIVPVYGNKYQVSCYCYSLWISPLDYKKRTGPWLFQNHLFLKSSIRVFRFETPFLRLTSKTPLGIAYWLFLDPPWELSLSFPSSNACNSCTRCPWKMHSTCPFFSFSLPAASSSIVAEQANLLLTSFANSFGFIPYCSFEETNNGVRKWQR